MLTILSAVLTSQVTYPSEDGRTSLTESTLAVQRCRDLRAEHEAIVALQAHLRTSTSQDVCIPNRGDANSWAIRDLSVCSIDCSAPVTCMTSESCKCTRDRCGDKKGAGPFPSVNYSNVTSFRNADVESTKIIKPTLAERVEQIPWDAVILPSARRSFNTPLADLPKVHVVDLPDTIDTHLKSEACYNIDKSPLPFMGDHILIEALRNSTVSIDDADFVMVPYYQVCNFLFLFDSLLISSRSGMLL